MLSNRFAQFNMLFLSISITAGCTPQGSWKSRITQKAPSNSYEANKRFLASSVSESDLQRITSNSQAQVRVLNSNHGFYEFSNVDKETLQHLTEHLQFTRNEFIPIEQTQRSSNLNTKHEGLLPCVTQINPPTLNIRQQTKEKIKPLEDQIQLVLGETLTLDGSRSRSHPDIGGDVKLNFRYLSPEESLLKGEDQISTRFKFTPDSMGVYELIFVVQDKRQNCEFKSIFVAVTANTPFDSSSPSNFDYDESEYKHLLELEAASAHKKSLGSNITIAIIDSGINYNHPDLVKNIAVNESEIPGNGIDDDGNGFIDDSYGFDFYNSDPYAFDDLGHGSHVAGLAAASTFGVAPNAKLLPLKSLGHFGGDAGTLAAAIKYAVDNGAQIINLSIGTPAQSPNPKVQEAIDYAEANNVLTVAASGNGHPLSGIGMNNDTHPMYPASLKNKSLISVAAKDDFNALAPYSNYGVESVDITAPGGLGPHNLIQSSYFNNPAGVQYLESDGTSLATPLVSGVAALIMSLDNRLTALQVKNIILSSGTQVESLKGVISSGRTLNAKASVNSNP